MDLTTVTVQQFMSQFSRDFPYFDSIQYNPTQVYNIGDEVFYAPANLFYQSLVDGQTGVNPQAGAAANPQTWIKYADSADNWVQDQDILNAFAEAQVCFNQGLFGNPAQVLLGYLYMTAHYLCNDLKAARGGVNSSASFPVTSRSVGSVSEAYAIPAAYTSNPIYAMYTQTAYGMKFLAMALPNMTGNMAAVFGGAQP